MTQRLSFLSVLNAYKIIYCKCDMFIFVILISSKRNKKGRKINPFRKEEQKTNWLMKGIGKMRKVTLVYLGSDFHFGDLLLGIMGTETNFVKGRFGCQWPSHWSGRCGWKRCGAVTWPFHWRQRKSCRSSHSEKSPLTSEPKSFDRTRNDSSLRVLVPEVHSFRKKILPWTQLIWHSEECKIHNICGDELIK